MFYLLADYPSTLLYVNYYWRNIRFTIHTLVWCPRFRAKIVANFLIILDRRQAAPRFVIKPQNAFCYEGQSVKLYCRVIGVAAPTVSWLRNNQELRQSVKFMKRYSEDNYYFIINRVKLDDRGEYIIRAENHYGATEEVVFLNVQRKYLLEMNGKKYD